ncbi:MAG: c-type cytochrome [Rhodocyclaceae bacterium]|nr:c-type cytochrome [Rhodocyclaceae bacterium]
MRTLATPLAGLALAVLAACAHAGPGPLKDFDPPLDPAFAALIRNADLEAGSAYFERKCSQCHDGQKDGGNFKGPHLWNVMGRVAATHEGFRYSEAMKQVKHRWTYATLDYYLKDTEAAVPGRDMNFVGIEDDATRANVIAYIRNLSDTPPALP